jgi:hypothetical protein
MEQKIKWAHTGIGEYYISNTGELKNLSTHFNAKTVCNHHIAGGYKRFGLSAGGKKIGLLAHRLVAKAFIKNPLKKPQVNHKNGNRLDNRVENLEWCTKSENEIHKQRVLKTGNRGEKTGNHKLKAKEILKIRKMKQNHSYSQLASIFSVSPNQIYRIVKRKHWNHI